MGIMYELARKASHLRPAHRQWMARQEAFRRKQDEIDVQVQAIVGNRVVNGPFKGMEILHEQSFGAHLSARLLGTYEQEILPGLASLLERPVRTVVDVGCAEGYYAVGLAYRDKRATVYAYDVDPEARRITAANAAANGAEARVVVRGLCTPEELIDVQPELAIIDIEGGEDDLITAEVAARTPGTAYIIECHDFARPGVTERLVKRFADRPVEVVPIQERRGVVPPLGDLTLSSMATDEHRNPDSRWLVVRPAH